MTELDVVIEAAFKSTGKQEAVNKVYLTFIRTLFFVPIKKEKEKSDHFSPLFTKIENQFFMSAFDSKERFITWAGDHLSEMDYIELSGKEIINGIKEAVYLCINVGTSFYKEFSPEEIQRLKIIVARIEQIQ